MLLGVGVFFWQSQQVSDKEYKLLQLQRQLANVTLRVDKALILKLVDETQAAHRRKQLVRKQVRKKVVITPRKKTPAKKCWFWMASYAVTA